MSATPPEWNLDISVLLGSGFVAAVLLLALVERLRRTFATRQEMNGVCEKFNALQSLYLQVRETADGARARAIANQAEQKNQQERLAGQVVRMERLAKKLESVGEAQAAHEVALEHLGRRLDEQSAFRTRARRRA